MPSVMTHCLAAKKTLRLLSDGPLKRIIDKFEKDFLLGANGPDILYFYNALPWQDQQLNKYYMNMGNQVHETHINDFYRLAIERLKAQPDETIQMAMISYLSGHLCHWALDSMAHPFIFYRTDGTTSNTKYWHYRYESMLDNYMMDQLKDEMLIDLPPVNAIDYTANSIQAIASIYCEALRALWGHEIDASIIGKSLRDFRSILMFTYDPIGVWYAIMRLIEIIQRKDWAYTAHFLTMKKDDTVDVLNLTHQKWCNPCDCSEVHHESFLEIFDLAIERGLTALGLLQDVLTGLDAERLLEYIRNQSYVTGYPDLRTMKYYNPIY